jgi:hypothetical protein
MEQPMTPPSAHAPPPVAPRRGRKGRVPRRARSPRLEGLARDGAELGEDQVLRFG